MKEGSQWASEGNVSITPAIQATWLWKETNDI
jgi:hypothetical protein